jgi:hypothetical protein
VNEQIQLASEQRIPAPRSRTARLTSLLREIGPYAAIELILPGGSLIALLLWFCRRDHRVQSVMRGWRTAVARRLDRSLAAIGASPGRIRRQATRSPACA